MTSRPALLAGAALLLAAAAPGGVRPPLPADAIVPALVLPQPPAAGSAAAGEEMAELRRIEARRTQADLDRARADGATKDVSIFDETMPAGTHLLALPATAALFALVRAEEKRDADAAKAVFRRMRPWAVDPTLQSCGKDDDAPLTSYPSGHTTMGYAMAAVLARLVPDRAPAIMARAARYADSRMICEVHFRSDIVAGQALGMIVAERLIADPVFQRQFIAARRELNRQLDRQAQ